ncbi:type II secretion system minor pseudopilin GspK [Pacificoceanicola onchidii]|uniref:type II secretion system minor pseudopilin GspK n=1 Tax=Pacificoceanicola onchidii TaxID=2562685 RepID=UPI0010A41CA3|nr:type II secretion system minor pseudopilin GspK [Pacificoceanicola onchidii]
MRTDRGFVLVNALVIVAALSAVAVFLLTRSEAGQARLEAGLAADQLALNLDAFEALSITSLARDTNGIDHAGEDWAQPLPPVALAQGQVTGQLEDLQGRYNVNWLAIPGLVLADEAFDRLLTRLGVGAEAGSAIRDFLQPGGPRDRAGWRQLDPPLEPRGGAILDLGQLRQIPGLSERSLERLLPYIAAVPGVSQLNVNTAPQEVLSAFFPQVPPAQMARLMVKRRQEPFPSRIEFLRQIGLAEEDDDKAETDGLTEEEREAQELEEKQRQQELERTISVHSDWFRLDASAEVRGRMARRVTVLSREGVPAKVKVTWAMTFRP